jgi:hypothetical protein
MERNGRGDGGKDRRRENENGVGDFEIPIMGGELEADPHSQCAVDGRGKSAFVDLDQGPVLTDATFQARAALNHTQTGNERLGLVKLVLRGGAAFGRVDVAEGSGEGKGLGL